MSLTVVSTPIGNYEDITLRAVTTLKSCDVIICEETKPAQILLRRLKIPFEGDIDGGKKAPPSPDDPTPKKIVQLNEHSKGSDLKELISICRNSNAALISDCGTPGFCDPGSDLVQACYQEKILVQINPGPSSLMALLSITGEKLGEFHFVGFLPAERLERAKRITALSKIKIPFVVMDTPYRLGNTLQELAAAGFSEGTAVLGVDLTGANHQISKSKLSVLAKQTWGKHPFVLMVFPL